MAKFMIAFALIAMIALTQANPLPAFDDFSAPNNWRTIGGGTTGIGGAAEAGFAIRGKTADGFEIEESKLTGAKLAGGVHFAGEASGNVYGAVQGFGR